MKEVKALAVMTRPELEQALADVNVTRRLQHKLLELQKARIVALEDALRGIAEHKGRCIYSLGQEFREGSNAAFEEMAHIADEALAATEPRP